MPEVEKKEIKAIDRSKETNAEATNRIRLELLAEDKLNERRDAVMNWFFGLTGVPMTEEQFQEYNHIFNIPDKEGEPKRVYNIKTYIRDKKIPLLPEARKDVE